ncbi:XylR family transcriptional regulator [Adhaeretor mobilis]|uniref:XylR family transcriptional regulator n=1 Tax=Adhaeretor mobilis TaxID=1930276 RepID=UPI0011A30635|nr:DNA-binding transcriptional regulator [Adhaeretor mobilis]
MIIETSTSFGRNVISGIGRFARENGPWSLYLEQRSIYDPPPGWLKSWHGQGVICNVATEEIDRVVQGLDTPLVSLNTPKVRDSEGGFPGESENRNEKHNKRPRVPYVLNDDIAIGRMAAEHLLENGYRLFGFVGHEGVAWSDGRREGFRRTIEAGGGHCDVFQTTGHDKQGFGQKPWETELADMVAWLDQLEKPVGVMAATDFRALQVLDACRQANAFVPEGIAVIGVDNEEIVREAAIPNLSSVMPNAELVGYHAAQTLHELMSGRTVTNLLQYIEPVRVVVRQSTSSLAIQDPFVADAMQFIRQNACDGINVTDVLKHIRISRTALQQRFLDQTNHTIHEEIVAARILRIKELLSKTEMAIPLIAERVGINSSPYLSVLFKKHTGMTLSEYRRQKQSRRRT